MVAGDEVSVSVLRCALTASFSSDTSFALIDRLITRFLRSTLIILASTSAPTVSSLRASSTLSRDSSEPFNIASMSLPRSITAPLASTSLTVPLTIAPLSFSAT